MKGHSSAHLGGEVRPVAEAFEHGVHHTAHGCRLPSPHTDPKLCWGWWAAGSGSGAF